MGKERLTPLLSGFPGIREIHPVIGLIKTQRVPFLQIKKKNQMRIMSSSQILNISAQNLDC